VILIIEQRSTLLANADKKIVMFKNGDISLYLHKPHPGKEFLEYQIKYVLDALEREGWLQSVQA
jgi:hypothetical protein